MKIYIDPVQIHYKEVVPEVISNQDLVLVFLHEALGSIGQWKQFPALLCKKAGLKGIVYERQGHGESDPFTSKRDEHYLHNYALKELPQFIEKVIPSHQKIVLVGHSDGGSIALLYASAFPERIHSVVTMAAHVVNEPETIAGVDPAVKAFSEGKLNGLYKYHGDKTETLFCAWADTWRSEPFRKWDIRKEIVSSGYPGLFIQGADDQYGTPLQLEIIQENFKAPSKAILLEGCGHHPHLEKTNEVVEVISNWMMD